MVFPPSIINDLHLDFLYFLSEEDEELPPKIKKQLLEEKYFKFYKYINGRRKLEKNTRELKNVLNDSLRKLAEIGFLDYNGKSIENIHSQRIGDFAANLKHVKKAKDRFTRYAIFHLFKSGKKDITLQMLEKILKDFNTKNLKKIVDSIVKKCYKQKLKISFNEDLIVIHHAKSDPEVGRVLLTPLYYISRKPAGRLEDIIIQTVEYESVSGKDIALLTGTDKGHVSKAINRLIEEGVIQQAGWLGNARYYETNCDNCPYDREKDECHSMTKKFIQETLKSKFHVTVGDKLFSDVDNHILRNVERTLKFSIREPLPKIETPLIEFYDKIFQAVLTEYANKKDEESREKIATKLPRNYNLGLSHGLQIDMQFQEMIVKKLLSRFFKGKKLEEVFNKYLELDNKFRTSGKI